MIRLLNSYFTYSGYQIGVSHVSKGFGCEDYSGDYIDSHIAVAVISDGHGDKNCFRSAKGAQIACSAAIDRVKALFFDYDLAVCELKRSPDRIITELEKAILYRWNCSVMEDISRNPFTEQEYQGLEESVLVMLKGGQRQQKVYGCTLILCVFLADFWFGIQIGDGKCVVCDKNGLYTQPIPWDHEGCVGNRSTSLCQSQAIDSFRYCYGTEVPVAAFVASDGVDESFDENGLYKCYYSVGTWIRTLPAAEYSQKMAELLGKISQGGSGDDVSIACIVNRIEEIKKPYATSAQVAEKMEELYFMLKELEQQYLVLESKKQETAVNEDKLVEEMDEMKKTLAEKQEMLEEIKCEKDNLCKSFDSVKRQLIQASAQFAHAKDTKQKVDEYWTQLGGDIYDNSEIMNYIPLEICEEKSIFYGDARNKKVEYDK